MLGCFLLVFLLGCAGKENQKSRQANLDFIEKFLDKERFDQSDLGLIGKVKGVIEYEVLLEESYNPRYEIEEDAYVQLEFDSHFQIDRSPKFKAIDVFNLDDHGRVTKYSTLKIFERNQQQDIVEYNYDSNGNLIKRTKLDFSDNLKSENSFSYNEKNELVKHNRLKEYTATENRINIKYEGKKMIIIDSVYKEGRFQKVDSSEFEYGEFVEDDEDDDWFSKRFPNLDKEYDDYGNLISYRYHPYHGDVGYYLVKIDYNKSNQKIREITYSDEMSIVDIKAYLYSKNDNLIQESFFSKSDSKVIFYNEEGEHIGDFRNSHTGDTSLHCASSFYDAFGDFKEGKHFSYSMKWGADFESNQVKVEYDSIGNWVEKLYFRDDSLRRKTIREIIYF